MCGMLTLCHNHSEGLTFSTFVSNDDHFCLNFRISSMSSFWTYQTIYLMWIVWNLFLTTKQIYQRLKCVYSLIDRNCDHQVNCVYSSLNVFFSDQSCFFIHFLLFNHQFKFWIYNDKVHSSCFLKVLSGDQTCLFFHFLIFNVGSSP